MGVRATLAVRAPAEMGPQWRPRGRPRPTKIGGMWFDWIGPRTKRPPMHDAFQPIRALLALAAAAPLAGAGALTLFEGPAGGPGAVRTYDDTTGALLSAPPELADLTLLPVDLSHRTPLEQFLPGRARHFPDVAGAGRIALPQNRGSLFHYSRGPAGARTYGYFCIAADGFPRVLVERPAIGAGGDANPFLARVAVAPDGRAVLCATLPDAGGDLLEVRIASTIQVVDRTAGYPPLRIAPRGLALSASHAWAATGRGILRASRADDLPAGGVAFAGAPSPAHYSGDLVLSPRGQAAAFTAGDDPSALHAWVVGADGVARRASRAAAPLSSAGSAPAALSGPYLAVSDDAQWCAWRTEGLTRECFVARPAAPAAEAPEQLSSDARFLDTLDEVAVFFFRGPGEFVFAMGERAPTSEIGIEKVDLFRAWLTPGAPPVLENLTLSSGDATEPFLSVPQIDPSILVLAPDRRSLLLHDDSGQGGDLTLLSGEPLTAQVLLGEVKSFDWIELAGRRFGIGLQRSSGTQPHEVHSILADFTGPLVLSATLGAEEPTAAVATRTDGWIAWIVTTLTGQRFERLRLPTTTVESWAGSGPFGTAADWTGVGIAFGTTGAAIHWPLGGAPALTLAVAGPFQILAGP